MDDDSNKLEGVYGLESIITVFWRAPVAPLKGLLAVLAH